MATYVISDIHGEYDMLMDLLEKISLQDSLVYEEIEVAGKDYLLVHAGLGGFDPEKDIEDYSLKEIVWDRAEYDICNYKDKYVITGHTPTHYIYNNPNPGYSERQHCLRALY